MKEVFQLICIPLHFGQRALVVLERFKTLLVLQRVLLEQFENLRVEEDAQVSETALACGNVFAELGALQLQKANEFQQIFNALELLRTIPKPTLSL